MKKMIYNFVQKTKYYVYVISILLNLYASIEGYYFNILALVLSVEILFLSLLKDEIL